MPILKEERPLIRVVHDESTYYANSHQTFFWGDDETSVLRQKSLGASIMVSDFIDEVGGFLCDNEEMARLSLEINKDSYFNNDLLMRQVEKAINIFEKNILTHRVYFSLTMLPLIIKFQIMFQMLIK